MAIETPKQKRIKVTSRGFVITSRGRCRTPIPSAYREHVNVILDMITREHATVIEILPDGSEIRLTEDNYNLDNTLPVGNNSSVVEQEIVEDKLKRVETSEVVPSTEVTTDTSKQQLTRKQRRELERKQHMESNKVKESDEDDVVDEPSTEIPQDAISE